MIGGSGGGDLGGARNNRRASGPEILPMNLTPLIDMFTTILIFLMLNFSTDELQVEKSPDVQLPTTAAKLVKGEGLRIEVTPSEIRINGETLKGVQPLSQENQNWDMLQKAAEPHKVQGQPNSVMIVAHKSVPYRSIERAAASLSMAGFNKFYLITERKDEN